MERCRVATAIVLSLSVVSAAAWAWTSRLSTGPQGSKQQLPKPWVTDGSLRGHANRARNISLQAAHQADVTVPRNVILARNLAECTDEFSSCIPTTAAFRQTYPLVHCSRSRSCSSGDEVHECVTASEVCPAPVEAAVPGSNTRANASTVTLCNTLAAKVLNAADCKIEAPPSLDNLARELLKSFRGTQTVGKFIADNACDLTTMGFLIYGAQTLGLVVPTVIPLALLPLVLWCWATGSCKVLSRRCRRWCRCCREPEEILPLGRCRKMLIMISSVIGFGGLIGVAMMGPIGPLDDGPKAAANAECAAQQLANFTLNGDSSADGFAGLVDAVVQVERIRNSLGRAEAAAVAALADDAGVLEAVSEAGILLRHVQETLHSQAVVANHTCDFCNFCCGSPTSPIPVLLQGLQDGILQSFPALRRELQPGGALGSTGNDLHDAYTSLLELHASVETGPAGALIDAADFFSFSFFSLLSSLTMAYTYGAQTLVAIGLVAMIYGIHWCCCLRVCRCRCMRRCAIGQREHPAPQCVAVGWCGGCLAAALGISLALVSYVIAGVSGELCLLADELSERPDASAANVTAAFSACLSQSGTVSRDLFKSVGLDVQDVRVAGVRSGLAAALGSSVELAKYTQLLTEAQSRLAVFSPPWGAVGAGQPYHCIALDFQPKQNGHSRRLVVVSSKPCDPAEFAVHAEALAGNVSSAGQGLSTALAGLQAMAQWGTLRSELEDVASGIGRLRGRLDCGPVFERWDRLRGQLCGGLVNSHSRAGTSWFAIGALGFIGALAQYKLWRRLRDNRSLYWDAHEDEKPTGVRKYCACFLAVGIGESAMGPEDGATSLVDRSPQLSKSAESPSAVGSRHGHRAHRLRSFRKAKPAASKSKDIAAERLTAMFFESFELTVEEAVRAFLQSEFYTEYEPVVLDLAISERVGSWKTLERERKAKKPEKDLKPPAEPSGGDPAHMFKEGYGEVGADGIPTKITNGEPLDKKALASLRKDHALASKQWCKYLEDKRRHENWLLYTARRETMEEGIEVNYPEEIAHLRPISPASNKPMKVILRYVPADTSRAIWNDELRQVAVETVDPKVRRHKKVEKKIKGLPERCFTVTKSEVMARLETLCKGNPSIWEGIPATGKGKSKVPVKPVEPKGLVNPATMFSEGPQAGKYETWDDSGLPATKAGGQAISEKELKALTKQQNTARKIWDAYQQACAAYEEAQQALNAGDGSAAEAAIPAEQKEKSQKEAGLRIVRQLIEKLILERAGEIVVEVNSGKTDPEELSAMIVKEELEEEEVITDPVLKAVRQFDAERSNQLDVSLLRQFFDALAADELEVGTHRFFGELIGPEVSHLQRQLEELSMVTDGRVEYAALKDFIEGKEVPESADELPANLVGSVMGMHFNGWLDRCSVGCLWSPRSWRARLEGPDDSHAEDSKVSSTHQGGTGKESGEASPRMHSSKSRSAHRNQNVDKDEEDAPAVETTNTKPASSHEQSVVKTESSHKKGKNDKRAKAENAEEEESGKRDKKEKKEKKDKKEPYATDKKPTKDTGEKEERKGSKEKKSKKDNAEKGAG